MPCQQWCAQAGRISNVTVNIFQSKILVSTATLLITDMFAYKCTRLTIKVKQRRLFSKKITCRPRSASASLPSIQIYVVHLPNVVMRVTCCPASPCPAWGRCRAAPARWWWWPGGVWSAVAASPRAPCIRSRAARWVEAPPAPPPPPPRSCPRIHRSSRGRIPDSLHPAGASLVKVNTFPI